jgi:hypothetical protein
VPPASTQPNKRGNPVMVTKYSASLFGKFHE